MANWPLKRRFNDCLFLFCCECITLFTHSLPFLNTKSIKFSMYMCMLAFKQIFDWLLNIFLRSRINCTGPTHWSSICVAWKEFCCYSFLSLKKKLTRSNQKKHYRQSTSHIFKPNCTNIRARIHWPQSKYLKYSLSV